MVRVRPLPPGDHLFQVRETIEGVTGPVASYRWTTDIPKKCVLRLARARVFVYAHKRRVRLVIHYTTWHSARVRVSYALAGSSSSLKLGTATSQFKKKGVFRLPVRESKTRMSRVHAAKRFKVHLESPAPAVAASATTRSD